MLRHNRAQFAIEFVVIIAFMFIIFLGFTAIITSKILESKELERERTAESIAALAKNEIDLAKSSQDGYTRQFDMPQKIEGNSYAISLIDSREIVVTYIDKEQVVFLGDGVAGTLNAGTNKLRKQNGIVFVNS